MKSSTLLLSALACCTSVLAEGPQIAQTVPGAFIAEFEESANNDVSAFYSRLGDAGHAVDHRLDLKYNLFKGVSFQLKGDVDPQEAAEKIAAMPEVKQLWPVRVYHVPDDVVVWKGDGRSGLAPQTANQRRAVNASEPDTFSPHLMTQVDKLRAEGITGKGVKIAVVDTGIDYRHPALGGCFGQGCLVSFGTDLVGDNYNGFNTPHPDNDPLDTCEGHGSHVAGIIAAQPNPYGFTGAAPDVTLGAYRVFGCGGSAGNDVLIAAFNQAYQDGANIITASIGGASGWSEDPWAVAVSRIVEAGVPCTVSAGNDGSYGLMYASTAADGKRVTAVASVDNILAPSIQVEGTFVVGGVEKAFGWTSGVPKNWGNVSLPLYILNTNTSDPAQGCSPLPDNTPDLSKYIVLIRRGTCTFVSKATNAAAKGAQYIMFYNNVPTGALAVEISAVSQIKGAGMVTAAQGVEWVKDIAAGSNVTLNIVDPSVAKQRLLVVPNNSTGGFLSTYTSWGPTFELDLKPQVAAPGGLILSTYPLDLGAYAVLSGTSMACPLTAAIVALVSNVRGTLDPAVIENVLSATANPNLFQDGRTTYPFLAPVAQQGAGLIQAYDAAHAVTVLSKSSIAFNDTDNLARSQNFSITNTGSKAITYKLANVGAATGYTLADGSIYPDTFPNELVATFASLRFSPSTVTVPAGATVNVGVYVSLPQGLNAMRLPVYSGYITLNGTNGDSLSLPYQGVVGSMKKATVLDGSESYLTKSTSANFTAVPANTTFVLSANGSSSFNSSNPMPAVYLSLALGSAYIRADVVPTSVRDYNAGRGYSAYPGSAGTRYTNVTTQYGQQTIGNIFGFPLNYTTRGAISGNWTGLLEDGSFAPAGKYKIVLRALHIFGNINQRAEYDVAETVPFTIQYK